MAKLMLSLIFGLGILSLIGLISGQSLRDKEKQVKDQILGRTYDGSVSPRGENGTGHTNVNVSLHVKNILALDDSKSTLEMQVLLQMQWNDPRLSYTVFPPNSGPNLLTLSPTVMEKVWIPEIYFANAVKVESDQNKYLRVFPSGDVNYSAMLKITSVCPMDLKYYPHDSPECELKISSYGSTSMDLRFKWKEPIAATVDSNLYLRGFDLYKFDTDYCDAETKTGNYSCLKFDMYFNREFSYYLIQVYIPCSMLVIVSWLSYWLHPIKSATARLITSVAALGLGTIGAAALNLKLPHVSYTKAIDVWTGTTLTFIFISLVEFVTINYLNQYGRCVTPGKKQIPDSSEAAEQQTPLHPSGEDIKGQPSKADVAKGNKWGSAIDIVFRIAIPVLFLLFIIMYWLVYV